MERLENKYAFISMVQLLVINNIVIIINLESKGNNTLCASYKPHTLHGLMVCFGEVVTCMYVHVHVTCMSHAAIFWILERRVQ